MYSSSKGMACIKVYDDQKNISPISDIGAMKINIQKYKVMLTVIQKYRFSMIMNKHTTLKQRRINSNRLTSIRRCFDVMCLLGYGKSMAPQVHLHYN